MPVEAIAIPECLRIGICPNCAYSLAGCPATAVCPECGRPCDYNQIVLYGNGKGDHAHVGNTSLINVLWHFWMPFLGFAIAALYLLSRHDKAQVMIVLVALSLIFAMAVFRLIRRQENPFPGRVQVRLGPRECVQYDHLPKPSLFLEAPPKDSPSLIVLKGALLAVAYEGSIGRQHPGLKWLWLIVFLASIVMAWKRWRKLQHAIDAAGTNAIADLHEVIAKPLAWSRVKKVSIQSRSSGWYTLRLEGVDNKCAVDADLHMTAEQAKALEGWIRDRKGQPSVPRDFCEGR